MKSRSDVWGLLGNPATEATGRSSADDAQCVVAGGCSHPHLLSGPVTPDMQPGQPLILHGIF